MPMLISAETTVSRHLAPDGKEHKYIFYGEAACSLHLSVCLNTQFSWSWTPQSWFRRKASHECKSGAKITYTRKEATLR